MKYSFAQRVKKLTDTTVRDLLRYASKPNLISFAGGLPMPESFPVQKIKKVVSKVLEQKGANILQYSLTEGILPLRERLVDYFGTQWKKKLTLENILITTGSQQALDLLAKTFIDKDDLIFVEAPTYLVALSAFNAYEPCYETIKLEPDGLSIEDLEKKLRKKRPKFIYSVTCFHNPTGYTLSQEKRKKLVKFLEKYQVLFIEDSPYKELYFTKPVPDAASFYKSGKIIFLGSFSKIFCPGLRLGFIIGPKDLIEKLVLVKQGIDLHSPTLSQYIAAEILKDKEFFASHLNKVRKLYKKQRDYMLAALKKYAPPGFSWNIPEGGMFLWSKLPKEINCLDFYHRALKAGVAVVPGNVFYAKEPSFRYCRLTYVTVSRKEIEKGVKILADIVKNWPTTPEVKKAKKKFPHPV